MKVVEMENNYKSLSSHCMMLVIELNVVNVKTKSLFPTRLCQQLFFFIFLFSFLFHEQTQKKNNRNLSIAANEYKTVCILLIDVI